MVALHDMGDNDTHLLELLSLSLVLDVTPSASQQERDSDSEHTTERSHAAQNSKLQETCHIQGTNWEAQAQPQS